MKKDGGGGRGARQTHKDTHYAHKHSNTRDTQTLTHPHTYTHKYSCTYTHSPTLMHTETLN